LPVEENKIRQINPRSEYFQDILDKVPSRVTTLGSTGMLIIFVLACLGLRVIKYPDVITSEALITTETPPVELHTRASGRILALLKKDQEKVKSGDWIIVLNNSADYKDVLKISNSLKHVSTENFWTSIDTMHFEESTDLGDLQNVYSQFAKSAGELKLFLTLKAQARQLSINSDREKGLVSLKQQLSHQLAILERECAISKLDYERNLQLDSLKIVARTELEQKEIAYLAMKNNLEQVNGSLINTQLQAELLKKENVTLKTDENNTYFTLRRNVLQYYNELLFQLAEWQNKYVLEAPIDGILNFYEIRSEDQFLSNEQKVFTIVPANSQNYFAIARLPVANSGKVRAGLSCTIKLNNYPYMEFGMLKGTIQSISAAAKEGFYSVKVKLPGQLVTSLHKQLYSKSELSGQADIIVEDLTLFDRLFNFLVSKSY